MGGLRNLHQNANADHRSWDEWLICNVTEFVGARETITNRYDEEFDVSLPIGRLGGEDLDVRS